MAVYGGDVGLDEFAKHPNAKLLWETAQGRVTLGHDLAVWSSHDGEDTLFNEFAQQARAQCGAGFLAREFTGRLRPEPAAGSLSACGGEGQEDVVSQSQIQNQNSKFKNPQSPWNLYFRVTMPDAIELGLLNVINRTQGKSFTPEQFLADCRARAGSEEIFEQSYMCNPLGASTN